MSLAPPNSNNQNMETYNNMPRVWKWKKPQQHNFKPPIYILKPYFKLK